MTQLNNYLKVVHQSAVVDVFAFNDLSYGDRGTALAEARAVAAKYSDATVATFKHIPADPAFSLVRTTMICPECDYSSSVSGGTACVRCGTQRK